MTTPMVQVYYLTLGEVVLTLIGPVSHLPELGIEAGPFQGLETGDVIPAEMAAAFLTKDRGTGAWARNEVN